MVFKTTEKAQNGPVNKAMEQRDCRISNPVRRLLIEQISHELYNHNLYRTFANFYGVRGLPKLEEYYIKRAEEEKVHHDWIINYLNEVDAPVSYPSVPEVTEKPENLFQPFDMTVAKEVETTKLINDISDLAIEEKDWQTFHWLDKLLVSEQIEEESLSRTVRDMANMDASWLVKQDSILDFYENRV